MLADIRLYMKTLKSNLSKRWTTFALYTIVALILINTFFTYQYKKALGDNHEEHALLNEISKNKETIISNLNNIDMSLRGFLLVGNEAFVDTYSKIKKGSLPQMRYLETTLPKIGIPSTVLSEMTDMQNKYFDLMDRVIALERSGNHDEALAILKEDHGTAVWMTYMELSKEIDPLIKEKADRSDARYNRLLSLSLFFQALLFMIGTPTLIYTAIRLVRNEKTRVKLYHQLDQSNRALIFDSAQAIDTENEKTVINEIIKNLNKASDFIKGIASGNYNVTWEGFRASAADNHNAISGQLLNMRDEMKQKREEMVRQQWVSDGLNQLNTLIREHQDNFSNLTDNATSFIIRYVKAQQGSLFYLNDNDEGDSFLELVSAYAFDRKKYLEKRINIGQGIVGQCFLEGQPVYLAQVPNEYVKITSGLGDANPTCITVYPLKYNENVIAILEVASFQKLDAFTLEFLAGASKNLGAALVSIRTNEKTRILLETSRQQAEEMKAQEEEMRQNLEELQATQEEMKRRENELRSLLDKGVARRN